MTFFIVCAICSGVLLIYLDRIKNKKEQNNESANVILKILMSLLMFVPLVLVYYFGLAFLLGLISGGFIIRRGGSSDVAGAGAFLNGMIGGIIISPILTIITIIKAVWKK